MEKPTLSICIPTYNRGDVLFETIQTILQYKSDEIEVVVNDNHSTDSTTKLLEKIKDSRLKVFYNDSNLGIGANKLLALKNATGKYALLLLDKDYIKIDYLSDIVEYLKTNDILGGCFSLGSSKREYSFSIKTYISLKDKIKNMSYLFCHPSGYFFNCEKMNDIDFQKFKDNFELIGNFLGDYLITELIIRNDAPCVIMDYPFCFKSDIGSKYNAVGSVTYSAKNENLYFTPNKILAYLQECFICMKDFNITPKNHCFMLKTLLVKSFKRMTLEYAGLIKDPGFANHYHIKSEVVTPTQMWNIRKNFIEFIKEADCYMSNYEKIKILTYIKIKSFFVFVHYINRLRKDRRM